MNVMVMLYVRLIELGSRTIDTVPEHLREEVQRVYDERNPAPEV